MSKTCDYCGDTKQSIEPEDSWIIEMWANGETRVACGDCKPRDLPKKSQ